MALKPAYGGGTVAGGGDVSGPGSSTTNAVAVFQDTTGQTLTDVEQAILTNGGSLTELELFSPDASGSSRFALADNVGGAMVQINYNQSSGSASYIHNLETVNFLQDSGGTPALYTFQGDDVGYDFTSGSTTDEFSINYTSSPDTNYILRVAAGGTNGGTIDYYYGDRTPEGNVSAEPGSVYYRQDGVNSGVYQLLSATTSSTGWVLLDASGGDVVGPGSSTTGSICFFDSTTGKLIDGFAEGLLTQTATDTIVTMLPVTAAGKSEIKLQDSIGDDRFNIFYENNLDENHIEGDSGPIYINVHEVNEYLRLNNDEYRVLRSNVDSEFIMKVPTAIGSATHKIHNSSDSSVFEIEHDQLATRTSIKAIGGSQKLALETTNSISHPIVYLVNSTEEARIFVSDQDPDGVVTSIPGAACFRVDELDSSIYVRRDTGDTTSGDSWAEVQFVQQKFLDVTTSITVPRSVSVILAENTSNITLTLPTPASTAQAFGFTQEIVKTEDNTAHVTIDAPAFYGFTGDYILGRVGDSVRYLQTSSRNILLNAQRHVNASMSRPFGSGTVTIASGGVGDPTQLTDFTTEDFEYPGLLNVQTGNDRIKFSNVENLTAGDLYRLDLTVSVEWPSNDDLSFIATVDDSGISTDYKLSIKETATSTTDIKTLSGHGFIRTGTDTVGGLDTFVEIYFKLTSTGSIVLHESELLLTKVEGR